MRALIDGAAGITLGCHRYRFIPVAAGSSAPYCTRSCRTGALISANTPRQV